MVVVGWRCRAVEFRSDFPQARKGPLARYEISTFCKPDHRAFISSRDVFLAFVIRVDLQNLDVAIDLRCTRHKELRVLLFIRFLDLCHTTPRRRKAKHGEALSSHSRCSKMSQL